MWALVVVPHLINVCAELSKRGTIMQAHCANLWVADTPPPVPPKLPLRTPSSLQRMIRRFQRRRPDPATPPPLTSQGLHETQWLVTNLSTSTRKCHERYRESTFHRNLHLALS